MGEGGWQCAKSPGNEGFRRILDGRRVSGTIKATGDNCHGWGVAQPVVAVIDAAEGDFHERTPHHIS